MKPCKHYPRQYWMSFPQARSFYREALAPGAPLLEMPQSLELAQMLCTKEVAQKVAAGELSGEAAVLAMSENVKGLLAWGQWQRAGAVVYELAPALARELWESDAGDLRPSDLLDRGEGFYVHFGLQHHAPVLSSGIAVEGAYVFVAPGVSIRIVLCGRRDSDRTQVPREGRYDLRLLPPHTDRPVDEAVAGSLQADLEDVDTALATMQQTAGRYAGAALALKARLEANSAVYRDCVRFLLNIMAYRRFVDDSVVVGWGPEVPASLGSKAAKGGKEGNARPASFGSWGLARRTSSAAGSNRCSRAPAPATSPCTGGAGTFATSRTAHGSPCAKSSGFGQRWWAQSHERRFAEHAKMPLAVSPRASMKGRQTVKPVKQSAGCEHQPTPEPPAYGRRSCG